MKGTIHKTERGWIVKYWEMRERPHATHANEYGVELHPDDVKEINEWSQMFDNIEGRIASSPEVEFEIKDILTTDADGTSIIKYAKLIHETTR